MKAYIIALPNDTVETIPAHSYIIDTGGVLRLYDVNSKLVKAFGLWMSFAEPDDELELDSPRANIVTGEIPEQQGSALSDGRY